MRRVLFPLFLFSIAVGFSQEGTIDLKNKIVDKKSENTEKSNTSDKLIRREPLLPKSIYIGELGDYNDINRNRVSLLNSVDLFLKDLQNNRESRYISEDFKFIFNTVYFESLTGKDNELIRWNIGFPELYGERAEVELELYYRDRLYIGSIYFEKIKSWKVNDLQLDITEKKVFDPSSPS